MGGRPHPRLRIERRLCQYQMRDIAQASCKFCVFAVPASCRFPVPIVTLERTLSCYLAQFKPRVGFAIFLCMQINCANSLLFYRAASGFEHFIDAYNKPHQHRHNPTGRGWTGNSLRELPAVVLVVSRKERSHT